MSKDFDYKHIPVLIQETLECLAVQDEGTYVDCTLGGGGHSAAIYNRLSAKGHLISLDKDDDAIKAGGAYLESLEGAAAFDIVKADFSEIGRVLNELGISRVDGILADLGVSSWQLDNKDRGFSYRENAPLDMRMDSSQPLDAYTIVNTYDQEKLTRILKEYGEERYASRISRAIVSRRQDKPVETTNELADLVCSAMPAAARREDQHPARRTFQAIRIAVNNELDSLQEMLQQAIDLLNNNGRLCVISFHSLEDRIVKETFRKWENPCICPRDFPVCTCGRIPLGKAVARKGHTAAAKELEKNPRSASARLRCFMKIEPQEVDHG